MTRGPRSGRCTLKRPIRDRASQLRNPVKAGGNLSRMRDWVKLASCEVFAGIVIHRVSEDWPVTCAGCAGSCWRAVCSVFACHAVLDSADAASAEAPVALQTFTTSVKVALHSTSHRHGSRSHFQWSSIASVPLAFPTSRLYVPVGRNRDVRLRHQPIPIVADQWKDCSHCYS